MVGDGLVWVGLYLMGLFSTFRSSGPLFFFFSFTGKCIYICEGKCMCI